MPQSDWVVKTKLFGLPKKAFMRLAFAFLILVFAIGGLWLSNSVETAVPPTIISYQGKLLEGGASATTTKSMMFLLYDASSGGSLLYTAGGTVGVPSTVSVSPSQGIFSVDLGAGITNAIDSSIFKNNSSIYLEVWIDGTQLTPRKQITASPFALNSKYLMGYEVATASSSVYIPLSDANGNLTFSGDPQSSGVSGGLVYINPATADANETLFGVALNGTEKFRVDEDGDGFFAGTLEVGTSTLSLGILSVISNDSALLKVQGEAAGGSTFRVQNGSVVGFQVSQLDDFTSAYVGTTGQGGGFDVISSSNLTTVSLSGDNMSYINQSLYIGTSGSEAITTSTFALNGNDLYVADLLGVGNSMYIENDLYIGTSTLHLNGDTSGGVISMTGGTLTIDSASTLSLNTTNNQNIITGSGYFGIGTTTPAYNLTVSGTAYIGGQLNLGGNDISGVDQIIGNSNNITIGDAGSDSHSLSANDDLFISGAVEIDGIAYFDNFTSFDAIATFNTDLKMSDDAAIFFATASNSSLDWSTAQATENTLVWGLGSTANSIIFTSQGNANKDFDHSAQTNPTIFIHSATDPDTANTQWLSLTHNAVDGVITTGLGDINLMPATGYVGINTTTPAYNLTVSGTAYISATTTLMGYVGIGTTAPRVKLDVNGDTNIDGQLKLRISGETITTRGLEFTPAAHDADNIIRTYGSSGALLIQTYQTATGYIQSQIKLNPTGFITFNTSPSGSSNVERIRILNNGNVGIGTSTPAYNLTVSGTAYISATTTLMGYVGINTTTALQALDVSGKIALDGTTVLYRPTTSTGSLIVGNGGTLLSHSAGTEGYYNTFVGLSSGSANTSGERNTVVGSASLLSNTTGDYNTAFGQSSLVNNSTGSFNTANGYYSLFNGTGNTGNTAIGANSFWSHTTGNYNTTLGTESGSYITGGVTQNTTSNNSLFLGYNTRAFADGGNNEIVIGSSATGIGSNTVTLGNDSITTTALKGNVGINTTTPAYALTVSGTAYISSALTMGSGLTLGGNLAMGGYDITGVDQIIGNGNNITIGDAGTDSHTLTADDDLFISGQLEVNGYSWFDAEAIFVAGSGANALSVRSADATTLLTFVQYSDDGLHMGIKETDGYANNNLILTTLTNDGKNHDHSTASANPTLIIHSATDPDTNNTQWLSLTHNQTDGVITTGAGNLNLMSATGYVGINTTTANYNLEVDGSAYITRTLNIGTDLTLNGNNLMVDGDMERSGVSAWIAGSSATLTKETTNPHNGTQVLKVAYNGVSAPSAYQLILTVGKTYRIKGWARGDGTRVPRVVNFATLLWTGTASTDWQEFDFSFTATGGVSVGFYHASSAGYVEFDDVSVFEVGTSIANINTGYGDLNLNSATGYVGINTTTPAYNLTVSGTAYISGASTFGGNIAVSNGSSTSTVAFASSTLFTSNLTDASAGNTAFTFNTLNSFSNSNLFKISESGIAALVVNSSGYVGINTTTPAQALDVSGKVALDGTTVLYRPTIYTGTLIVGDGGTLLSNTSGDQGYYNTFVGLGVGSANTTGYYNTGIGANSLGINNVGYNNTANGYNSLGANTSGNSNSAFGSYSLRSNSTGSGNTSVGYTSLYSVNGGNNTAIGNTAGRYIDGGGSNAVATGAIYVGFDTRASASGNTNETVIGYSAIGNGSNTVTLGNNSVVSTFLKGKIAVGSTTTPAQALDVSGKIALGGTVIAYRPTSSTGSLFLGDGGNLTTGANNTFVGLGVGTVNTSGFRNSAIGSSAFAANTTGDYNTVNGAFSLGTNISGFNNTAIGYASLYFNTTGKYNTAVGSDAGRYITGGSTSNQIASSSVYLGANTKAFGIGGQNEIVIGYDATGIGSNTVTLGNDNITTTTLKGYIGIGTNAPIHLLTVGTPETPIGTTAKAGFYNAGNSLMIFRDTTNDIEAGFGTNTSGGSNVFMGSVSNHDLVFRTNNSVKMTLSTTGKLGIGTSTPQSLLDIQGTLVNTTKINLDGSQYNGANNSGVEFFLANSAGTRTQYGGILMLSQVLTAGAEKGRMRFYVANSGDGANNEAMSIWGDNVGIGTTTPAQALDVSGKIALDGTTVLYRPTTSTGSLIVGNGGTALSHATGSEGYYNTFVGYNSGIFNTTGYFNTASGYYSLYGNTTGLSNTGFGYCANCNITTGSNNTAIGTNAGRWIANGSTSNTTSSQSTYLGSGTKALADGNINETVIGYNTIGNGSNTVTLGNDSITSTFLKGNIAIGSTTTPTQALDVSGKIALDGTTVLYRPTTYTNSLIVGDGGTNLSHTTGITGYDNTFVGLSAGSANTTGFYNTAIGSNAMVSNLTGADNTAIGAYALNSNTTGDENNAFGSYALGSNTTGTYNTAIGGYALMSNTTGGFNTAVGLGAGRFITGGAIANATSTNSLYLGYDTRALASGDSNEIVIGYQTTGNGSNTVTLGNTNITKTVLRGAITYTGGTIPDSAHIFDTDTTFTLSSEYLFSVRTGGVKKFSVAANGDVHASGTLNASSATVGTPGAPGDLAERVDINPVSVVEAGDVLVVDATSADMYTKSQGAYVQEVAGVVSTNPTITVGNGKTSNTAVMAMVGRVPIKVSTENGPIARGDLLITSSIPGHAMKYDSTKDTGENVVGIVGIALDSLTSSSSTGKIMGLIKTGWVNNKNQTIAQIQQDLISVAQNNAISIQTDPTVLTVAPTGNVGTITITNDLSFNNFSIINIRSILAVNNKWSVDEDGRFITKVTTTEGDKNLYALQSQDTELIYSGTGTMVNGEVQVLFSTVESEIIDAEKPIKVSITLTSEANGVFVSQKDSTGFTVKELQSGTSNATFDWVVIASRRIGPKPVVVEPVPEVPTTTPEIVVETPTTTPIVEAPVVEPVVPVVVEPVVVEPIPEPIVVVEPAPVEAPVEPAVVEPVPVL